MRIRKNAAKNLCPPLVSTKPSIFKKEEDAEAAAMAGRAEKSPCRLNQSPWDAMFFAPTPREIASCLYKEEEQRRETVVFGRPTQQFRRKNLHEGEGKKDIFRVDREKAKKEKKARDKKMNDKNTYKKTKKSGSEEAKIPAAMCKKTDGKGWRCRREVHPSHALCEHHLVQLRSYHGIEEEKKSSALKKKKKKKEARIIDELRGNGDLLSSDFFYYSGFGPRWGKKRRSSADSAAIAVGTDDVRR